MKNIFFFFWQNDICNVVFNSFTMLNVPETRAKVGMNDDDDEGIFLYLTVAFNFIIVFLLLI